MRFLEKELRRRFSADAKNPHELAPLAKEH